MVPRLILDYQFQTSYLLLCFHFKKIFGPSSDPQLTYAHNISSNNPPSRKGYFCFCMVLFDESTAILYFGQKPGKIDVKSHEIYLKTTNNCLKHPNLMEICMNECYFM